LWSEEGRDQCRGPCDGLLRNDRGGILLTIGTRPVDISSRIAKPKPSYEDRLIANADLEAISAISPSVVMP
jgi:hypothetical protein